MTDLQFVASLSGCQSDNFFDGLSKRFEENEQKKGVEEAIGKHESPQNSFHYHELFHISRIRGVSHVEESLEPPRAFVKDRAHVQKIQVSFAERQEV